jgi:hypothetical protein
MLTPDAFRDRLKKEGVIRSTQAIRSWCNRGLPGAKKIGGTWEIPETAVKVVLDGNWRLRGSGVT